MRSPRRTRHMACRARAQKCRQDRNTAVPLQGSGSLLEPRSERPRIENLSQSKPSGRVNGPSHGKGELRIIIVTLVGIDLVQTPPP